MAVNSSEDCHNAHSVDVFPDGGATNLTVNEMSEANLQNISNLHLMDKTSNYTSLPCILDDVDIEKGNAEIPKSKEDSTGYIKSDEPLTKEIFLKMGRKSMQLLMNHGTHLPKFVSRDKLIPERVYDTPTNSRSRKYKRSPSFKSFNSRRVVLLFSVLSSMGTIILIYLTLRVRQIADGNSNV